MAEGAVAESMCAMSRILHTKYRNSFIDIYRNNGNKKKFPLYLNWPVDPYGC